jgi:hypothetical protein
MKKKLLFMFITGVLVFTMTGNVVAQDSGKPKSKQGVVVLKIKKSDNGKTTVTDTTFTISIPSGHKQLEEYLAKQEKELENPGKGSEEIEVSLEMPDLADSIINDSVEKHFKYIIKDSKEPHSLWNGNPERFDYEFNVPCPPDFPPFPGNDEFEGEFGHGDNMEFFHYKDKRQTLSDIIGDIPMDRVKSFTIKDKKQGKRIIIDVADAPLFEKHEKVIIIRNPEKHGNKNIKSDRQVKVIINSEDDKLLKGNEEGPSNSVPPPPPPPGKK